MNKFIIFLLMLVLTISNASFSYAQENEQEKVIKKCPAPIERAHLVEDYLPILGKKMRENCMKPPKPFFVSGIYYHMQIPQTITNAKGTAPEFGTTEVNVGMYNAKVKTNSVGMRAGVNLFPFMSVFGVYIYTEGDSYFTAVADGISPSLLPNGYKLEQKNPFTAHTGAIGTAFSYGYRLGRVIPFAIVNGNYAWTSTDRTNNLIQTMIVGARVGLSVPLPKDMKVAFTLGGQYTWMPMGNKVQGTYDVTLPPNTLYPGAPAQTITSKYTANAEYASPWTVNAGIAYSFNRYFDVIAEVGFLTRLTAMVVVQANF